MLNTTCSYDQAMRAVHAENPAAAQYLDQSPPNQQFLQQYLAASPDQRLDLLHAIEHNRGAERALPILQQMMTDCTRY
jgi:hemophore-related protein